ncbi:MAG TPA: AAA family ATPase [Chthoniobacterales bacterium]|jgi:DNA polymerase-3 subunit delta'|nr:AAA family ATPase [Chthoniobacterales bacterium]
MAFSQTEAFEYLRRAHEQNRLGHAYLICGPAGSGKRALAANLAQLVTRTNRAHVFSGSAPEIFLAEPESKSRRIVITQVRALEHALQMRAAPERRKVAIIADADRLQPQAANAFLKTLEEPAKDSLLLLLTALPEALPDTIVSRCIAVPLRLSEPPELTAEEHELIVLVGGSAREAARNVQHAYRLAQEFQRLLGSVRERIRIENADALKAEEARYRNATDGTWLDEREQYYKALTESMYIQRRAALVETLVKWWSDVLRASCGLTANHLPEMQKETTAIAKRFTATEILSRIRWLEELRDHLSRNIQEALAIEVAFLRIFTS